MTIIQGKSKFKKNHSSCLVSPWPVKATVPQPAQHPGSQGRSVAAWGAPVPSHPEDPAEVSAGLLWSSL